MFLLPHVYLDSKHRFRAGIKTSRTPEIYLQAEDFTINLKTVIKYTVSVQRCTIKSQKKQGKVNTTAHLNATLEMFQEIKRYTVILGITNND